MRSVTCDNTTCYLDKMEIEKNSNQIIGSGAPVGSSGLAPQGSDYLFELSKSGSGTKRKRSSPKKRKIVGGKRRKRVSTKKTSIKGGGRRKKRNQSAKRIKRKPIKKVKKVCKRRGKAK